MRIICGGFFALKVNFLGTGAADWPQELFTEGNFFRRNSSILIDDCLLIDPGPHIFNFAEMNGTPGMFRGVKNIIVTHSHYDHFDPENVYRLSQISNVTLWGDIACKNKLVAALGKERAEEIEFVETKTQQEYNIGGYAVTSLRANHVTDVPCEVARMYLIEKDERVLYYGCDSAWIPTESWNIIKEKPINAMILELTCGLTAPDDWRIFEHNTLEMLELMIKMFRKYGCFASDVKYYVSHMARTLHGCHEELAKYLMPWNVTPAYDGFEIEI